MIRTLYRTRSGETHRNLSADAIRGALRDKRGVLWVDMVGEPSPAEKAIFQDIFEFDPLAIDDAFCQTHSPKLDDWGRYIFIVLNTIDLEWGSEGQAGVEPLELDCFLSHNYFVTYSKHSIPATERVWKVCLRDDRYLKHGSDHLLYRLTDEIASDAVAMVEQMREAIDQIEEQLFHNPSPDTLEHTFALRRMALRMHRTLSPHRDVIEKLSRDDFPMIDVPDRAYFRDVYDHFVRLDAINENLRDLANGALDTYLSLVNNRMNEAMRTMAVVTTLFMPISFLAGFFGMNFFGPVARMETWTDVPSLLATLALMIILPVGMFLWMRRKAWM